MTEKLIVASGSGTKSINPWDLDSHPEAWNWLSGKPQTEQESFYATVSAVFRAFNLKANTVASMPFILYTKSGAEFDASSEWGNKVKFLPNPQEILRLATLSYMTTNTIYQLRTSDALGYRMKGLYHAVPSTFIPFVNASTRQLEYITRMIGTQKEIYAPDDDRLIRMWRLDHTTEVLPSKNTEAKAIMSSAGIMHYQDAWVEMFYQSGGIKATLIGMKGLVDNNTREDKEKDWSKFLQGVGKWWGRRARLYNAEAINTTTIGAGVDDMKDNKIYEQAISNVAMGTGMPLSLLLANSANYATAQEEKATWYENDIIPFCKWLEYEYNRQLWEPMGFYMRFQPQTLDPNQQDETEKAAAANQYMDLVQKVPTYELFIGITDTLGIEVSDSFSKAAQKYYADKEAKIEEGALDANGQPIVVQPVDEEEEPVEDKPKPPAKWIPSIDELNELRVWQDVSLRKFKKGETMAFLYQPHYGGLPEHVSNQIKDKLSFNVVSIDDVKAAFDISGYMSQPDDKASVPQVKQDSEIMALAASLNKMAEAMVKESEK